MIEKMRAYAKEHRVPIINDEGLDFLESQITKYKVKDILELGSAIGYSAIMMASLDEEIHITTIEKDEERFQEAVKNIEGMNLNDRIDLHFMDALEFKTDKMYDLIFLDLAKSKYEVMLNQFYPNLKEGGIIVVDNLGMYGLVYQDDLKVKRRVRQLIEKIKIFREHILEDERFDVTIYDDIGDGIGVLVKRKEG